MFSNVVMKFFSRMSYITKDLHHAKYGEIYLHLYGEKQEYSAGFISKLFFFYFTGTLLYFGYSLWNSEERYRTPQGQLKFDRQVLLAENLDSIDIEYEMETIPAHRDDTEIFPPSPFKWDSL